VSEVVWLGTALEDLQEIKAFYEDREEGLGQRLTEVILDVEQMLRHYPKTGRITNNIQPEHRQLVCGHHLVIYRIDPSAVKIVAVIDCRRKFLAAWQSRKR
jgi:plasmid stabilization system protein ParE